MARAIYRLPSAHCNGYSRRGGTSGKNLTKESFWGFLSPEVRASLLDGDVAAKFLAAALAQPRVKGLLSNDHFSVDGTLIEAWASMKSFTPKGGDESPENKTDDPPAGGGGSRNREVVFHSEKRSNETHASTSDPNARLYRKDTGKEAKLCFIGHALMENRSALFVDACLTKADGHAVWPASARRWGVSQR